MTTTQFNLNLPITGSAVQDDAVDGTAGKVLLTGAFGLGATDEALTRLDTGNGPLPSGFYSGSGGNADAATFPVTGARSHPFLSLNRRISAGVYGIARVFFNGNVPVIWTSSDNGSNWDDPNSLFGTENLLGTVSESRGKPTGAVIEHGENANGYYTRFADGTQICWRRNWSVGPGTVTWTFPAAFLGGQGTVAVTGSSTSTATSRTVSTLSTSYQDANVQVRDDANNADTGGVSMIAIGRWF